MGLNSCLYETTIMHCRTRPKCHQFRHKIFMFYLDLDELDVLAEKSFFVGHNQSRIYDFRDSDHFQSDGTTIKEKVSAYLKTKGINLDGGSIKLLTNLRTFGYLFNPVSFYFCFGPDGEPVCVVPEIGNTFHEIKPFFLGPNTFDGKMFYSRQKKYYYISPFIHPEIPLDFQLNVPGEQLDIQIDDSDDNGKFLYTTMTGPKVTLNNKNLFWYTLKYPWVTFKVISLIHIHALFLWLKKIAYYEKDDNVHMQKEVYRVWSKNNKPTAQPAKTKNVRAV